MQAKLPFRPVPGSLIIILLKEPGVPPEGLGNFPETLESRHVEFYRGTLAPILKNRKASWKKGSVAHNTYIVRECTQHPTCISVPGVVLKKGGLLGKEDVWPTTHT